MRSTLLFFLTLALLASCSNPDYKPGNIYSVDTGEEKFRVVKVISSDSAMLYLKMYNVQFTSRPGGDKMDTRAWDQEKMVYMPLDKASFREWEPELMGGEPVSDAEKQAFR
jgi:hypothetical protein